MLFPKEKGKSVVCFGCRWLAASRHVFCAREVHGREPQGKWCALKKEWRKVKEKNDKSQNKKEREKGKGPGEKENTFAYVRY